MLSLVPNEYWDYGAIDAIRGLKAAWSRNQLGTPTDIQLPGVGMCLPVRSARAATTLSLKALGLPPGASIGVPLYCCPVVFKAVKAAGCRVRFIDVEPDTYCLSAADLAAKCHEVDAVIAVHMFGHPCNMPALRDAAPGKPFIEDCAQALGSRRDGRATGSFGDIAVFSFRSGKYLSVGHGGAVYCWDPTLHSVLCESIAALPAPGRGSESIHVATTWLRSLLRSRPLWGAVGARLWDAYSAKVSYASQSPIVLAQMYATDRDLAVRRMPLLPGWIDRQRSNADYYSQNLSVDPAMLCAEPPGSYFNRLQYPLLVPTPSQCDRLAAFLRADQISTARPYKDIAGVAAAHYGYKGDCPRAERVASTVLVIPCHHALKTTDVERIAACVNTAWIQVGGRPGARAPFCGTGIRTGGPPAVQRTA
jgi:perosamine synthetase